MHQQMLKLKKKVLGPEHSFTLRSISNLALMLMCQEKYKMAEKMHQQTLKLYKKTLSPKHPETH